MIEGYIDPKDLAEFHLVMDDLKPKNIINYEEWRAFLTPLKRELRTYPEPPMGSKYVRTYNLKRKWQYVIHNVERAEIGNAAAYAGWVQGIEQAEIHQNRWSIAIQVADERLKEWVEKLSNKVRQIWIR